jgi:hypothetical protein
MIRTIFLVTVLLTGCHKAAEQPEQKIAEPSSVKLLWMDDISMPYSGTEFENAFVLEPECRGLIFRHWNGFGLSDEERMKAMKAPHWDVWYNGSDGLFNGVRAIHIGPTGFEASRLDTGVDSAEAAAKKACFVAKQKGGQ